MSRQKIAIFANDEEYEIVLDYRWDSSIGKYDRNKPITYIGRVYDDSRYLFPIKEILNGKFDNDPIDDYKKEVYDHLANYKAAINRYLNIQAFG